MEVAPGMSALTLSRIQFAFTIGFHFIIVPLSIGLALMVVISERRYYKSGVAGDLGAANFWTKLFAATFALGVATGISMEFAFGTNWANYSRFVGSIFGAPLAAEGITAFFLESVFLGVLLFGRKRVSRRMHYVSAWLVLIGAHLSALWILVANSWMQTPRGYKVVNGRAVLTDFWAAVFNPTTVPRLLHVIAAAWITGCFVVAGISAWYLLKKRNQNFARRSLRTALVVGLIMSAAMPLLGHFQAIEVGKHQPVKMAAFEGHYKTGGNADMYALGWVDSGGQKVYGIPLPSMLSILLHAKPSAVVPGLDQVAGADRPPEQIVFQSYHLMVALGILFVLIILAALGLDLLKGLETRRWMLWLLVFAAPFPIIAAETGWIAAEVGRQPWIVQGLLRTSQGVSPQVSTAEVATTLIAFIVIYALLFLAWLRIFIGIIRKGPEQVEAAEEHAALVHQATHEEA
jgi:cytochrome d ubiquinol oxidase subunit I